MYSLWGLFSGLPGTVYLGSKYNRWCFVGGVRQEAGSQRLRLAAVRGADAGDSDVHRDRAARCVLLLSWISTGSFRAGLSRLASEYDSQTAHTVPGRCVWALLSVVCVVCVVCVERSADARQSFRDVWSISSVLFVLCVQFQCDWCQWISFSLVSLSFPLFPPITRRVTEWCWHASDAVYTLPQDNSSHIWTTHGLYTVHYCAIGAENHETQPKILPKETMISFLIL